MLGMLVPSIATCFLSTPYWEVAFVAEYDGNPYISAGATFHLLFGDSWQYMWPVVLIAVLQIFGAALVMSAIDRHFRTGRLSLRSPWSMVNNSIFPIALGIIVMSIISIVWRFLLFGLVMLVQVFFEALGIPAGGAVAVISVLAVGQFLLHVAIVTPVLFWAPIMFIYGYRFRDAAATSFKLLEGKRLSGGLLLPMTLCAGLQLLMGFLQAHSAISITVGFCVSLFTNAYTVAYVMLTFYGISDMKRRDIKPYEAYIQARPPEQKPVGAEADRGSAASPQSDNAAQAPVAKKTTAKKPAATQKKSPAKPNNRGIKQTAESKANAAMHIESGAEHHEKKRSAQKGDDNVL